MKKILPCLLALLAGTLPGISLAGATETVATLDATQTTLGLIVVCIFMLAYVLVMAEEIIHLPKSKPVVFAAGVIWILVAIIAQNHGMPEYAHQAVIHNFEEYSQLLLFLLVAMTYINAMEERKIFDVLRAWLVSKQYNYRKLFWVTGWLAFFLSPIADNLTTALVMCAVVVAVGAESRKFVTIGCINIVIAANAGGAFSPFGDITTLMVWQKGILKFFQFFDIFLPAVVNYIIPACIMYFAIPKNKPKKHDEIAKLKPGAKMIIVLFLATVATAVSFHHFLNLPACLGMMTGFGYLQIFAYYLKVTETKKAMRHRESQSKMSDYHLYAHQDIEYDIFKKVANVEWDTLFFFYGVILCVCCLAAIGYLHILSEVMYNQWGASLSEIHRATPANIMMGMLSAIVDNIPVMFAVLTMHPIMSEGQWLLITLTAGVGGSLLSIGSAAGVALMGQSKGQYTFFGHLRWTWAIFLGYIASVAVHIWLNADTFYVAVTNV